MRRAVFLEKNGTLLDKVAYNVDPARVTLARGAGGALRALKAEGFLVVVVSNQPGVALGHFALQALGSVETRIQELLTSSGGVDAFYYSRHLPQGSNVRYAVRCLCRKPQPGLLRQAARDWQIDLTRSWLIGDVLDDIEAGNRVSCRTVLVHTGTETEWRLGANRQPHFLAHSLREAARQILTPVGRAPRGPGDDDAVDVASKA